VCLCDAKGGLQWDNWRDSTAPPPSEFFQCEMSFSGDRQDKRRGCNSCIARVPKAAARERSNHFSQVIVLVRSEEHRPRSGKSRCRTRASSQISLFQLMRLISARRRLRTRKLIRTPEVPVACQGTTVLRVITLTPLHQRVRAFFWVPLTFSTG
jgi:hypothetical protein